MTTVARTAECVSTSLTWMFIPAGAAKRTDAANVVNKGIARQFGMDTILYLFQIVCAAKRPVLRRARETVKLTFRIWDQINVALPEKMVQRMFF